MDDEITKKRENTDEAKTITPDMRLLPLYYEPVTSEEIVNELSKEVPPFSKDWIGTNEIGWIV